MRQNGRSERSLPAGFRVRMTASIVGITMTAERPSSMAPQMSNAFTGILAINELKSIIQYSSSEKDLLLPSALRVGSVLRWLCFGLTLQWSTLALRMLRRSWMVSNDAKVICIYLSLSFRRIQ